MRRLIVFGACALGAVLGASSAAASEAAAESRLQGPKAAAFQAFVEGKRRELGLPSLAVGLTDRAGDVLIAQSGVREVGRPERVEPDDKYHVGSVTKPLTSTVAGRLVDKGVIRWDSTPAEIWPEWAAEMDPAFRKITLELILRHRAGLPPLENDADIATVPTTTGSGREQRTAFAAWLTRAKPPLPVGEHVYSNGGYGLAAAMMETAANRSWEDLLTEEVFRPLGMTSCGVGWPAEQPGQPRGHRYRQERFVPHDLSDGYRLQAFIAPAGDAHCSVRDMLTFGRAHLLGPEGKNPLLRRETWRKLHDAPIGEYALGWNVREAGFHHWGGAGTFIAYIRFSPSHDLVFFGVSNANWTGSPLQSDSALFGEIRQRALDDFGNPAPAAAR